MDEAPERSKKPRLWAPQWLASAAVLIVLVSATILAWSALRSTEREQVARIIRAEAQSDRAELERNLEVLIKALNEVRSFWSKHGGLPHDQWTDDAQIELGHFEGLKALIWYADGGETRYLRNTDSASLSYRPTDEELEPYRDYLGSLDSLAGPQISGPRQDGEDVLLVVILPSDRQDSGAGMVAVIDLAAAIEQIFRDVSPAYSIIVEGPEFLLHETRQPAESADEDWVVSGPVKTSLGTEWTVTHAPTTETVANLTTPATQLTLVLGLIVAGLMTILIFEYAGALARAKAAETAKRDLALANEDLAQIIEAHTEDLRKRNADLRTITDSVAHDLRNPLNALSMTTQLLALKLDPETNADERTLLERVEPSLRQMSDIIDRLVGLSALSHSTFKRETVDMRAVVEDVFEGLAVGEPPPRAALKIEALPPVEADQTLVNVLLTNLLSNALKYTRGNTTRQIRVGHKADGDKTIYFVADNGIGFDEGASRKMFEAFERLEGADHVEGLGLGLMICLRAVRSHGGKIWAEGRPDEGATFFFTLES